MSSEESAWPWRWPLRPCPSASPSCRCARLSLTLTGSRSRTALIPAADSSTAWPSRCTLIRITQTQVWSHSSGYDWEHLQTVWDQDEFVSICLCSSGWVPPERESDINITIIHSPSVNIWRRNISIKSIILNNSSSVIKCSGVNQERNLHRSSSVYKTNMCLDFDVRDKSRCTLSLEEELLWIRIWV